jgi:hypothetical protein
MVLVVVAFGAYASIMFARSGAVTASSAYYGYCPGGGAGSVYYAYCPPPRVPGHFKAYDTGSEVPLFPGEDLTLTDQFISERVHRGPPRVLMNPVEKRRSGHPVTPIEREDEHLKCYRLTGGKRQDRVVFVTNQFVTSRRLLVKEPNRLCAPAAKGEQDQQPTAMPADTQHYKCYRVEEQPPLAGEEIVLVDQFGIEQVTVRRAESLCNPVTKKRDGRPAEPPPRPDEHLVCYGIGEQSNFPDRNVHTLDQFGRQRVRVLEPLALCVPSTKS